MFSRDRTKLPDSSKVMFASVNSSFLYDAMDGQPQLTSESSWPTVYSTGLEPPSVTFLYWQGAQTGYFYPVVQDSTSYSSSYSFMEPIHYQVEPRQVDFSTQYQGQCYLEPILCQVEQQPSDEQSLVEGLESKDEGTKDQENEKPAGYKTRLCTHYSSGRKCPKRSKCQFAHGPKELRSRVSPAKDPRLKTMVCRSIGSCSLGIRCRFLHPEDIQDYRKAMDFEEKKDAHSKKVQSLHNIRKHHPAGSQEAMDVELEINRSVREYNGKRPRGDHYYDLHGMTTNGAEIYVEEIVVEMRKEQVKRGWFETGRGNHSKTGRGNHSIPSSRLLNVF
ncbi:hypothetical protein L3Y34_019368 [Caenorhabditis briggsae]|uniref:C3H1-type domain-containing protein n=1 Tax=Caenorhabditis briggsae TaxID=6238 RepID=A0AAE9DNY8_CAEBR|nr:hypothetical protein L3Y34_019368 [Caenorhabditis briggsae]